MKQYILAIILIALLMIAPTGAERINQDIEIRGSVATGSVMYDYSNFAGFWYNIDTNQSSETLTVNVTGRNADIIYQCDPVVKAYKNPDLGKYTLIGWMADKYVCYDNKSDKLVKLLIEWDNNNDRTLEVGESLEMPDNYTLIIKEIDLDGGKCYITLYKNGIGIDSEIVADNTTYKYLDDNDVLVCSIKVSEVFRGTDSNVVTVEYLYLQSEDILDIDVGDSIGCLEVTSTSGGITLKNDDRIELDQDAEVDIADGLYFKVADSSGLRYYLARNVIIECPESETIYITEYINVTEPCPVAEPEIIEVVRYVNVTIPAPAEPVNESPGMEGILALCGLTGIAYLIIKQKD